MCWDIVFKAEILVVLGLYGEIRLEGHSTGKLLFTDCLFDYVRAREGQTFSSIARDSKRTTSQLPLSGAFALD